MIDNKESRCTSLDDVHVVLNKWLYLEDNNCIDLVLATALSNQIKGTPIWLILCGNSGDGKTELLNGLRGLDNVETIDQITTNTLCSGKPNAKDLGSRLQDNDTILLILDMASLTSKQKDAKAEIWGQFRNLYDGFITKRTGNDTSRKYENCHVTLLGASTPVIRKEFLIHQELGTRELLYNTYSTSETDNERMDKALMNENNELQMKKEIQNVMTGFIKSHKIEEIEISEDIKKFVKEQANMLKNLRATVDTDGFYHECNQDVNLERPTRLVKQFIRIYRALKSLDKNYPDDRAKDIIRHIVESSGNEVRHKILSSMQYYHPYTISEMQQITRLGRSAVKPQMEALWNMKIIDKEVVKDKVGNKEEYVAYYTRIF